MTDFSKAARSRALKARLLLVAGQTYADGPTYDWLREVIQTHPDAIGKLAGVRAIEVRRTSRMGNTFPELLLHLRDGGTRDCSWKACVYGKESDAVSRLKAMRESVRDQLDYVRQTATPSQTCEICRGALVGGAWHVDHADPSFASLSEQFLREMGCGLPLVPLATGGYTLADGYWREAWREYHWKASSLRVVHAVCNLRRGRAE